MPFEPRHVGITYRVKFKSDASRARQSGYILQLGGKTVGGFHKTYASALRVLCKARGVASSKMLPLKPKFRKAALLKGERIPYLFYRRRRWYSPQVPLGETFSTPHAAMQAVKRSKKGKIFLDSAKKTMQAQKKGPLPPGKLAHRIKCLANFMLKDPKR